MIFEEIVLKDSVSGPARAMAEQVRLLGEGLGAVQKTLGSFGPLKMPKIPGEGSPARKAAPPGKPMADVDGPAMPAAIGKERAAEALLVKKQEAKDALLVKKQQLADENALVKEGAAEAKALFKQKAADQKALAKAAALEEKTLAKQAADDAKSAAESKLAAMMKPKAGPENLTEKMLADQAKMPKGAEPPPMPGGGGKLAFDPEAFKVAQAAAAQFKSKLEAARVEMVKAAAIGDHDGFAKAAASANQASAALAKLPEPAQKGASSMTALSRVLWNARNAMDVGRQTIEAGIGGIKNAFTSLAKGDVKGAVAGLTESLAGMAKMLDLVVPGLGQAVSAVISVAGGLVGITAGLIQSGAKFAIASSQAKQQMLSMFDAMGGGVVTGGELDDMLSDLADRISISKDELTPLTQAFLQMGVTGVEALEKLTTAAISAEAITKGGAAAFTDLQKKIALAVETGQGFKLGTKQLLLLRSAGIGVSEIAKKMGMSTEALTAALAAGTVDAKKFGDAMTEAVIAKGAKPLERLGQSFDSIKKKFDQDIGDLFEDIDVGPFMAAVKDLFSIFGQSTASGQAMKAGIGGFFKEVFALATKAVPIVKHLLLDAAIWAIKAYIAVRPLTDKIREFINSAEGSAALSKAFGVLWSALKGVAVVLLVVVGVMSAVAGAIVLGIAAASSFLGVIWDITAGILTFISGGLMLLISTLSTVVSAIWEFITGASQPFNEWIASAPQMAMDFIAGLVLGLAGGSSGFLGAVAGLASSAISAITGPDGFNSHSPSLVGKSIGGDFTDGIAGGVEAGGLDVHGAASGVATAAVSGASSGGGAGASGGGSGSNYTVGEININGADKSVLEVGEELVATMLERFALQAGL